MNKKIAAFTFLSLHIGLLSQLISSALPPGNVRAFLPVKEEIPDGWKQEMLDLVNKIRAEGCRCGRKNMPPAPPLHWDKKLERAAQLHAADMYQNKFMGHTGSNGSRIGERVTRVSYDWQSVGENVSWNYDTATDAVMGWKSSPAHCMTMMSKAYKDMGAAKQGPYWAQIFGNRMK